MLLHGNINRGLVYTIYHETKSEPILCMLKRRCNKLTHLDQRLFYIAKIKIITTSKSEMKLIIFPGNATDLTLINAETLMNIIIFDLIYRRNNFGICFIKLFIAFFFCSFSAIPIICCLIFDAFLIEIGRMQVLLLYPEANFGYILQNVCLCLLALLYQWITLFAEKGVRFQKISAKYVKWKTHLLQEFFAFVASFKDRMFLLYYYVYVIQ